MELARRRTEMTIEEINRRIAESEETVKVCEMAGNKEGADLARGRIRKLKGMKTEKTAAGQKAELEKITRKERPMRKKNRLTLANLCGGAVQEMVDRALDAVGRNIADPNMDPKKVREVNIKIKLAPREDDPEDVKVGVFVTKTLAPEQPVKTDFYVTKDLKTGNISIQEHRRGEIKGQMSLDEMEEFDPETGEIYAEDKVTEFERRAK